MKFKWSRVMEFETYLENEIKRVIMLWHEKGIYALSFLLTYNEIFYQCNTLFFPNFSIGYNTEYACDSAPLFSEERWNYAFWEQNNISIIDFSNKYVADLLICWYRKQGIIDARMPERTEDMYDNSGIYIGKGPSGYIELMNLISQIAKKLQNSNFIKGRFGDVPIIVHDLEYSWYSIRATKTANPNGEANDFLTALSNDFEIKN